MPTARLNPARNQLVEVCLNRCPKNTQCFYITSPSRSRIAHRQLPQELSLALLINVWHSSVVNVSINLNNVLIRRGTAWRVGHNWIGDFGRCFDG